MMTGLGLFQVALSRVSLLGPSVSDKLNILRNITLCSNPLLLGTTACLFAEPLKKKKKIDPQVLKQREERKKKRLEKQIRRLEKHARQLKPIEELEVPLKLIDERQFRARNLSAESEEEEERRALLFKAWAEYKHAQNLLDIQMVDRIVFSQQKALNELRQESEILYQEAVKINSDLVPFEAKGPVHTPPPVYEYSSPDGEYVDISRKW